MKAVFAFMLALIFVASNCFADILVCDKDNGAVLRFDDGGTYLGYFVPPGTGILTSPTAIQLGPDGNIYVSNGPSNDAVFRYTYPEGIYLGNFILGGGIVSITDLSFGPDGDLYLVDNNKIKEFDGLTGAFIRQLATGALSIIKLRFEPNSGDIICSTSTSYIYRLDVDYENQTNDQSIWGMSAGSPRGFALGPGLGPDGDIYVHDDGGPDQIKRYDTSTGNFVQTFTFVAPEAGAHIEFLSSGDLLVGDDQPVNGEYSIALVNGTTGLVEGTFISGLASTAIDFELVPTFLVADSGTLVEGNGETNDFTATVASDDVYWGAHGATFAFSVNDPVTQFELCTKTASLTPNKIEINVEAKKQADTANLIVTAQMFNWTTGQFEIGSLPGTMVLTTSDSTMSFTLVGDPADYVGPPDGNGDGEICVLLQTIQTNGPANVRTLFDKVEFIAY